MNIKVITLNMWLGGLLMDNIVDFLRKEQADILMLQEVYNGENESFPINNRSVSVLQRNLELPHYIFSSNFRDITPKFSAERGNAIFSRYPLTDVANIFYDTPYKMYDDVESQPEEFPVLPRTLQNVTTTLHGKTIHLFNTQGIWAMDGEDSERRLHMSDIIVKEITGKHPTILAGDFNIKPHTKTIKNIEKHLTSIFNDELTSTFNMKHKNNPGYATAVVDMMFVDDTIKVVNHYCPQVDVSDHLPLVAVLNI